MNDYRQSRDLSSQTDDPPMSRLFVICSKLLTEEDFREAFNTYGDIEDIWLVKDKATGENKGIAYIKFSKTSDAAKAQEDLDGKCIGDTDRPLKVLVAASRNQGSRRSENELEKCVRLFIIVPKTASEAEIRGEFAKYGDLEHVSIVKDRNTGQSKGVGYVRYHRFYHAALAFENCPSKYKAVFAEPKSNRNHQDNNYNRNDDSYNNNRGNNDANNDMINFLRMQTPAEQTASLEVICSSAVNQDQLWRLFDIIPGLDYCQLIQERCGPRNSEAIVVYTNPEAAIYAKEKFHGLEYPPGERLIVKITGMDNRNDNMNIDRGRSRWDPVCNVDLPPVAPFANPDSNVVRRCFIVLSSALSQNVLKNVFCCFGNLIDVYLLPNKNCGYVKYASEESAQRAIDTLNGAEVCGVRMKVMEAEELKNDNRKRMRRE